MLKTQTQRYNFCWAVFWVVLVNVIIVWASLGNHHTVGYGYLKVLECLGFTCIGAAGFGVVAGVCWLLSKWIHAGQEKSDKEIQEDIVRAAVGEKDDTDQQVY